MRLIRVNKAGEVFLLVSQHHMTRHDIADTVDHVDVHYCLGSERATKELSAHGIEPVGHARFHALEQFEGKVTTLSL